MNRPVSRPHSPRAINGIWVVGPWNHFKTMTDAQKDAADKIHNLMVEHFDGAVCVLQYEGEREDDATQDCVKVDYVCGYAQAVGLLVVGQKYLLNKE